MLSRKGRRVQTRKRYDVTLRIKNKDHLSRIPASINSIASELKRDAVLNTLLVCGERKANTLYLRTRDPGRLSEVKENISRIRELFKADLELVQTNYLFYALELNGKTDYKVDLKQLGEDNAVNVVSFYKKSSRWYLELDSLEDAKSLHNRGSIFMDGENARPTAIRAVREHIGPIFCFKCSAAGHYQDHCKSERQICGKCGGDHEARKCTLVEAKDFRCPNCSGEEAIGHANWSTSCQNPKTKAERKRAFVAENVTPDWLALHQQEPLDGFRAGRGVLATRAKRGRPSGSSLRDRKKRASTCAGANDSEGSLSTSAKSKPISQYFLNGQPRSSQSSGVALSSQDRDSDTSAYNLSSPVQLNKGLDEMVEVFLGAEETMALQED